MAEPAQNMEDALKERLQKIFDFKKISYDEPGESMEQDCLFIQIDSARPTMSPPNESYKVIGQCFVHAQASKLPYGYFAKRIQQAPLELTSDLFFTDLDTNQKLDGNIVRRSFNFVFLYTQQYDPNQGMITSVVLQEGQA